MFSLTIDTGNAAFDDGGKTAELARILRDTARKIERGATIGRCRDYNGNTVGEYDLEATSPRDALERAESFISGFEGDELQEGIGDLLTAVRDAIRRL